MFLFPDSLIFRSVTYFSLLLGKDPSLGVENLKYSGLIAGETSKAYDEIVTMNLV